LDYIKTGANQRITVYEHSITGDLNLDGTVSIADFITLASNFNKTNATWADGDLNGDGIVSISDFIDLASHFNQSISSPSAPTTPQPPLLMAAPSSDELPLLTSPDSLHSIRHSRKSRKHHHQILRRHPQPRPLLAPQRY